MLYLRALMRAVVPRSLGFFYRLVRPMLTTCYLCGLPLLGGATSGDHAVPSVLISRIQPKAKGFDYAGKLPTHKACNNRFGPEIYASKALDLLDVLAGSDGSHIFQHRKDSTIEIHALDASNLPQFTSRDLAFFKLIDVRNTDQSDWSTPAFFTGKPRTNATRDALFVALSVLAKSAAALLIKRELHVVPSSWRIYAIPFSGATDALDFDELLGTTEPFDIGVKVWLKALDPPDWLALYRAQSILVYLVFVFAPHNALARLHQLFQDSDILEFGGTSINDLLTLGWKQV